MQSAILSREKPSAVLANIEAGNHRVRIHLYVGEGETCSVNSLAIELLDKTVAVGDTAGFVVSTQVRSRTATIPSGNAENPLIATSGRRRDQRVR
ncbi:hypothetical protein ACFU44_30710 [Nocardia rhizosphaerihabitans]|uniref:hypothetical protein n=1 Tax=Nocardia rhizosphaerihabitans TaxID=1691570 RepID=UPI00366BEB00